VTESSSPQRIRPVADCNRGHRDAFNYLPTKHTKGRETVAAVWDRRFLTNQFGVFSRVWWADQRMPFQTDFDLDTFPDFLQRSTP
jgi:hypothetical protein